MLTILYFFWDGFSTASAPVLCPGMYRPGSVDQSSEFRASVDSGSSYLPSVDDASSYVGRACDQQL